MTYRTHALEITVLAAVWAATEVVPPEEVLFEVHPERTTTKTYELRSAMTTEESVLQLGEMGEHNPGEGAERESQTTLRVEDECLAAAEGRPTRLRRRYEGIESEMKLEVPEQEQGVVLDHGDEGRNSDLEDCVVLFECDPEDGAWAAAYDEDAAGEDEWLGELRADMDFLRFLPAAAVSPGDRWTIEADALADLFEPGGQLMVAAGGPDEPDPPEGGIMITMGEPSELGSWEELDGEVRVEFVSVREADGVRIGVLALKAKAEGVQDVAQEMEEKSAESGMDTTYDVAEIVREVSGEGELLWNLDAGCLHALSFEAEVGLVADMEWLADAGAMEIELALHQVQSGTFEIEVRTE